MFLWVRLQLKPVVLFSFSNLCAGTYTIEVIVNPNAVGGINSTDAGAVNYWAAYFGDIQHVKFLAGDVTWTYWR